MKKEILFGLIFTLISFSIFGADLSDSEILNKIDSYRLYSEDGFSFLFNLEEGDDSFQMQVNVRDSSGEEALCQYIKPRKMIGRSVLVLKKNFWYFDQGMNAPIRISPRQMLLGQASAGDISRIVYSQFYSIESMETVNGKHILLLTALEEKKSSYYQIRLEVEENSYRPLRAECLARTGVRIKTIEFLVYEDINGTELLTKFRIIDDISGKESIVHLEGFSQDTISPRFYNKDAMRFLQ